MTRIDSVRHAADVTKDSVRHAAEVAAPYASMAKDNAVHYGRQAGTYGRIYGRQAQIMARKQYDARLADRVEQARDQAWAAVPPKAADAMETAAKRTREGAKAAAGYTVPKVGAAVATTMAVAGPAKDEIVLRGSAALAALRGQVSPAEIERLVRRRARRRSAGRFMRALMVAGLASGAAVAAYKWWSKSTSPDWLVEPSEATEVGEGGVRPGSTLTVVDSLEDTGSPNGSGPAVEHADGSPMASGTAGDGSGGLDAEAEAKRADAEHGDEDDQR